MVVDLEEDLELEFLLQHQEPQNLMPHFFLFVVIMSVLVYN